MITTSDDVGLKFYTYSHLHVNCRSYARVFEAFMDEAYSTEWLMIGRYLSTLTKQDDWSDANFKKICKKAYGYFLKNGHLWKRPKQLKGIPH